MFIIFNVFLLNFEFWWGFFFFIFDINFLYLLNKDKNYIFILLLGN